jgi:hypothetical protein
MPPGQDHYYDVAKYSGLTAMTMGWAIADRPKDWQKGNAGLPADSPSDYIYNFGRGRFFQHRGANVYWFLRMQTDYYDARSDMAVSVMKLRNANGSWTDVVPPRPYTGGHHKPADPAAPCLVYRKGCAYLELHGGTANGAGGYNFQAIWRTARRTLVRTSTASVTPTDNGLRLSWVGAPGDVFTFDNFLPSARCQSTGVSSPGLTVTISGQSKCSIAKGYYAGGSRVDMRRTHSVTTPQGGGVDVTYAAG